MLILLDTIQMNWYDFIYLIYLFIFKIESYYVVQAALKLMVINRYQPPECSDYVYAPPHSAGTTLKVQSISIKVSLPKE